MKKTIVIGNKSGFYRIWFKIDKKQFSYVGLSKNIEQRIQTHFQKIRSFYDNKSNNFNQFVFGTCYYQLQNKDKFCLPKECTLYFKIIFMLYLHGQKPENIKWEILKEKEIDFIQDQKEEMDWIDKFDSEQCGFNDVCAKKFQLEHYLNFEKDPTKLKNLQNLLELQQKKNLLIIKGLEQTKTEKQYKAKFVPWLGFQLGVTKWNKVYIPDCDKVLINAGCD